MQDTNPKKHFEIKNATGTQSLISVTQVYSSFLPSIIIFVPENCLCTYRRFLKRQRIHEKSKHLFYSRLKDKVDNDWMADEALDEADLDAVLDNDNNDDDYQPDQEVK